MATKKDLVEAYSFSRRRLVTAFVSGAPGGREVEPTKPGRTIVGGLALAVLLLAGAAIAGVLKPNTDVDWEEPGLILSKEKGASYVILEPDEEGGTQVRPVINVTSAQLILGDAAEPKVVPQAEIDTQTPGADIGILGAPVTVPDTGDLVESGWTACTGSTYGVKLHVSSDPDVAPAPTHGFVVQSAKSYYVIAESAAPNEEPRAFRYELPKTKAVDNLLDELGLPAVGQASKVPADWLELFPRGGELRFDSLGLDGFGTPAKFAGQGGLPADAKVGDYYEIGDVLTVLTADGPAELTAFARAVFLYAKPPSPPTDLGLSEPPDVLKADPPFEEARWPEGVLEPVTGEQCAQLVPEHGELPRVVLAQAPGEEASAAEVPLGQREVAVEAGRGAYVLSGGWGSPDVGEPFVVDSKGFSYALLGKDAVENLGFDGYDAPVVPESWLELFEPGVALSVNAALCPPTRADAEQGEDAGGTDEPGEESRSCE